MAWWQDNRLRLIQNNLREIDANLDVDLIIRELKEYDVNVWMINAGGIFAFYPSKLEYQYVTPHLKKDLLGEAVEKAHRAGMKLIARFDFSKAHESIFHKQPDWFYRTHAGEAVNYGGIVHTCLNSYYQQEYSLRMIAEVIDNYPVDGIFFNMFGYQTRDYSGNEYGICYCGNCRKRFQEMYGLDLPEGKETADDETWRRYREFQRVTTHAILDKISDFVKARRPELAISTYHHHKVDIIRKESNTALSRAYPMWLYSASENVMSVENSWPDKLVSNCSINAIDLPYRFTGVSPQEQEIRLYENIAAGSGLDFCIIGIFDGYTDRTNYDKVKSIFRYHARNEAYYGQLESAADVALIKPDSFNSAASAEYRGIFKMLKERHVVFEAVEQEAFAARAAELRAVKAVIVPGIQRMTEEQLAALAELQQAGVRLIATGSALRGERAALARLFGVAHEGTSADTSAAYVRVDDRRRFVHLPGKEWIVVTGRFDHVAPEPGIERLLPLIASSSFGPPERAYGHQESEYAGCLLRPASGASGASAYYPWEPGALYYKYGFEDYKYAVTDLLGDIIGEYRLETDAHASVELFFNRLPDGSHMVQLLNLTGFNGTTYLDPAPQRDIRVTLRGIGRPSAGLSLPSGGEVPVECDASGNVTLKLPELASYEAIVLK